MIVIGFDNIVLNSDVQGSWAEEIVEFGLEEKQCQ